MNTHPPVFIISSMRSGSTLLRYLLDSHDHIACPPETKFLVGLEQVLEYPQVLPALSSLGYSLSDLLTLFRALINELLMGYTLRMGKLRWIDKTPSYYKVIPFIESLFEKQALYIILVRHPLDCIASLERFLSPTTHHDDPDIVGMVQMHGKGRYAWAKYWIDVYDRTYCHLVSDPSRYLVVRYEDLVTKTDSCLREISMFINEPAELFHPEKAFSMRHTSGFQDSSIRKTTGVHTRSIDKWREWLPEESRALWQIVGATASRFDYKPPD